MIFRNIVISALAILLPSAGQSEEYHGLIVKGNHKKLPVVVKVNGNDMVTSSEIKNTIKLGLLSHNIKFSEGDSNSMHYLLVYVTIIKKGTSFSTDLFLQKNAKVYAPNIPFLGHSIKPSQGDYKTVGTANRKHLIIDALNFSLHSFLTDYVDSNRAHLEDSKIIEDLNVKDE